jgi:hypothetical protein
VTDTLGALFPYPEISQELGSAWFGDEQAPVWAKVRVIGPGQWRVRELPDGRAVDVLAMIHNARLVVTDVRGTGYERAWCYSAMHPVLAVLAALGAAMEWDGSDDTTPDGWTKDPINQVYRPDGDPAREHRSGELE